MAHGHERQADGHVLGNTSLNSAPWKQHDLRKA